MNLLTERRDSRELLRDPMVLQASQLADRLRVAKGSDLESEDYFAISEATGVPEEYIRFLEQNNAEHESMSFLGNLRSQFFALNNDTRRYVLGGLLGTFTALLWKLGDKIDSLTSVSALDARYGLFQAIAYVIIAGAIANSGFSRNQQAAAISGAIYGGSAFIMSTLFGMLFLIPGMSVSPPFILVWALGAGLIGYGVQMLVQNVRGKNSATGGQMRQEMLKQLVDLQDQLREGEQSMTFLSLDVVGSTRMKLNADALAVEFTFNEYHQFVERIVEKHFGRVHSTAGDGITAAFDHPQNAFNAARQIQTGLIELNTLRNKIGEPIELRAGIHTGEILAPKAGDVTSVNFASVIDIAAHLQKECPIGGIAVSDSSAAGIMGNSDAIGTQRVSVHNTGATIWQKKKVLHQLQLESSSA